MPAEGVLNPSNGKLKRVLPLPYTLNVCTVLSRVSARPESPLAAFEISSEEENVSFVTVWMVFMSRVIPSVVELISSVAPAVCLIPS